MDNIGISLPHIQDAAQSFKMICFRLLNQAYLNLMTQHEVNKDWEENAITEKIVDCMNILSETKKNLITVFTEKKLKLQNTTSPQSSVNNLPRIDITVGGFGWNINEIERIAYYMEAKNLYSRNFKKTGRSNFISAKAYAKRYVDTGVDHILDGYYPYNTLLLGYVLVGTINDAIDRINQALNKDLRYSEIIAISNNKEYPNLTFGLSHHPSNKNIEHCFLLF